ncbi:MAG TPA: M28 family peptidase [Bryobacteraceae bacterium]|nr:M28 family peptidase [Bryobacteraceae bacterium]
MQRRVPLVIVLAICLCGFQAAKAPVLTPEIRSALEGIRADAMKADLSFIASDLLEGRNTPSRGLDLAAEYIAAQFRRAGLEPGGDDGYFQTARMAVVQPDFTGFELDLTQGGRSLSVRAEDAVLNTSAAVDMQSADVFKVNLTDSSLAESLTPRDMDGKVVLLELRRETIRNFRLLARKLSDAKPVAILILDGRAGPVGSAGQERLVDPEKQSSAGPPRITLSAKSAASFYAALKPGTGSATATIHIAAPRLTPVRLHNVIGILRGSDPALQDTCELLTAHYDHIGERQAGKGDRIYNGANDDGSGTVSVIEIARALSKLQPRPRRSILFIAFFGEEEGMLGSRYYARHPVWPLKKTIAHLNLEQVGRTDDSEGPQVESASLTGFDYSDVTQVLQAAGKLTGIRIYKHPRNSDLYYASGDNIALAEVGVVAHTLAVSFEFPDYHGVGDEWQKIDYDNMAKVDRTVALSLILLASDDQPPHWNEKNPRAGAFAKARNAQ